MNTDLSKHRQRLLQVLDRHADHGGVDARRIEGESGIAVEVSHKPTSQPRVGGEFSRIHAVADDLRIADLGRQVADPAAH